VHGFIVIHREYRHEDPGILISLSRVDGLQAMHVSSVYNASLPEYDQINMLF